MNDPISITELILQAGPVVKIVMATLILASMVSWIMIFQRGFALSTIRRDAINFEGEFWSGKDLRQLFVENDEKLPTELEGLEWLEEDGVALRSLARRRQVS